MISPRLRATQTVRAQRPFVTFALAGALTATLTSGCTTQWMSMSPPLESSATSRTASGDAQAVRALVGDPTPGGSSTGGQSGTPAVNGDLDTGSAHRTIAVGSHSMQVDYWTTNPPPSRRRGAASSR